MPGIGIIGSSPSQGISYVAAMTGKDISGVIIDRLRVRATFFENVNCTSATITNLQNCTS